MTPVNQIKNINLSSFPGDIVLTQERITIIPSNRISEHLKNILGVRTFDLPVYQKQISYMELSGQNLWRRNREELVEIFSTIPPSICCLDLTYYLEESIRRQFY